jgi:hypothetical protein
MFVRARNVFLATLMDARGPANPTGSMVRRAGPNRFNGPLRRLGD